MEDSLYLIFGNNFDSFAYIYLFDFKILFMLFLGTLCFLVGLLLAINFTEFKNQIKALSLKNIFSGIFTILSLIFFDKNYLLYNFNKKIFTIDDEEIKNKTPFNIHNHNIKNFQDFQNAMYSSEFQDEYDYFDSFFTGENLFKLFLIIINLIPLFLNNIWGQLITIQSKSNFLLRNLIPNPVFISLMTLLLDYFFIDNFRTKGIFSLYNIVNFTCYLIFISFLIYEFYITKNYSFWAIFYFILILINFIGIHFLYSGESKNINFSDNSNNNHKIETAGKS